MKNKKISFFKLPPGKHNPSSETIASLELGIIWMNILESQSHLFIFFLHYFNSKAMPFLCFNILMKHSAFIIAAEELCFEFIKKDVPHMCQSSGVSSAPKLINHTRT